MASVIVFGPTGNIGSVAARTAAEHGAKVALAMRDPTKTIPGLTKEAEQAGDFTRIQADMQKPDTVAEAVKKSGATRAFIYLAHGSSDHMKSTIEALKGAGIDFVVFLSSFTINPNKVLKDIPSSEVIPYWHAQVEVSLDEVYGSDNYVAVRPGAFATNLLWDKKGIIDGHVPLFGANTKQDSITPGDMGRVSGYILANGPKNGQKKVYLYGPQLRTHREAIEEVGKVLGKEVKITELNAEEGRKHFTQHGLPPPIIDYFMRVHEKAPSMDVKDQFALYEEGVENVKLYTGRSSTTLQEWLGANKELFDA